MSLGRNPHFLEYVSKFSGRGGMSTPGIDAFELSSQPMQYRAVTFWQNPERHNFFFHLTVLSHHNVKMSFVHIKWLTKMIFSVFFIALQKEIK